MLVFLCFRIPGLQHGGDLYLQLRNRTLDLSAYLAVYEPHFRLWGLYSVEEITGKVSSKGQASCRISFPTPSQLICGWGEKANSRPRQVAVHFCCKALPAHFHHIVPSLGLKLKLKSKVKARIERSIRVRIPCCSTAIVVPARSLS